MCTNHAIVVQQFPCQYDIVEKLGEQDVIFLADDRASLSIYKDKAPRIKKLGAIWRYSLMAKH